MKWLIRLLLAAAVHGVLFLVAALLFERFSLSFTGWLVGTLLFTLFTMLLRGVMASLARRYASSATFLGGLALTFVGLVLTNIFTPSEDFSLSGAGTWVFVTLIVWVGTVIYDQVDDRLIDAVRPGSRKKA